MRFWATPWPSRAVPWGDLRSPLWAPLGLHFSCVFFRISRGHQKNYVFVENRMPLIILMISRGREAPKKYVGETLVFRPLGSTFSHFGGVSFPSFQADVASKKHLFVKPVKNQRKINDFDLSRASLGCSRGPPWRPLGSPGGTQRAAKEVFGGSICVLGALWKVSGTTLGPQGSPLPRTTVRWESILVLFRTHFGAFLFFVWCLLKPKQKTEETTTDQTLQLALKTENRNNGP